MIQTINNAMSKRRDAIENGENDKGFTLIELMVVIIIIGILAAIAIPAFLNQREAAWESSVKADLSSAQIAAESYATSKDGKYTGLTVPILETSGLKITTGNTITVVPNASGNSYVLTGKNTNTTTLYTFDSLTGKTTKP